MASYHKIVASKEGPNARNSIVIHPFVENVTVSVSKNGVSTSKKNVPGIALKVNKERGFMPSCKHDFAMMLAREYEKAERRTRRFPCNDVSAVKGVSPMITRYVPSEARIIPPLFFRVKGSPRKKKARKRTKTGPVLCNILLIWAVVDNIPMF